jgi:hypothetical protein
MTSPNEQPPDNPAARDRRRFNVLQQLIDRLIDLANITENVDTHVMLDVAGRWTWIERIDYDADNHTIFIHSED